MDVLPRRAFVLLALSGCLPRSGRADERSVAEREGRPLPAAGPGSRPAGAKSGKRKRGKGDPPPHLTSDDVVAPTAESLEARAEALRERYGPHGFSVTVEAPFVVLGDQGPDELRRRSEGTIRWAVQRLQQDYFRVPPRDIVEVWLFGDDDSYRKHARAIFDDDPDTPYGYFTPRHQALIMNISTGGGTLVHELVHPFIDSDFPKCPSWFNEGLASLYEQCRDHEGHIWGLTNWRLAGLQEAIDAGRLPSFSTLMSTTRDEFYDEDPGSNYAQARYLCYALQERGLLRSFYRDYRRDVARDPTGEATLRAHVGDDLVAFQREWERWVMTLRYG